MEKTILPEISNWITRGQIKFHDLKYNGSLEKEKNKKLVEMFVDKRKEYYICGESTNSIRVCCKINTDAGEYKH